jgi:hypothetical protein
VTPKQAFEAGYTVGQGRGGWYVLRRETRGGRLSPFVLRNYRTRKEALADLHSEMTDPDGVLRPELIQTMHDEITAEVRATGRSSIYDKPAKESRR